MIKINEINGINKSNTPPNQEQMDLLFDTELFKLLAEPIRIDILKLLAVSGPMDITTIEGHFKQDRSVISRHLKHLYEGGLLFKVKESRSTLYQVDGMAFLGKIEGIADNVRSILQYCCGETYEIIKEKGMTYQSYLELETKKTGRS